MTLTSEGYNVDHRGIIRLYDGTVVYIVEIEYSTDGKTFWEKAFNPYEHYYEGDGQTILQGHRWMRVKHAEDTTWQLPMYINAEDGKSPELRLEGTWLQWGYADVADSWTNLLDTTTLKGEQGDQGPQGSGLQVDKYCYYGIFKDSVPTTSSGCNTCNPASSSNVEGLLYFSLGDGIHIITSADIGASKYKSDDGETWIALGVNDEGRETRFIADDALGTNYIDYTTTNTEFNSRGKIYTYISALSKWEEVIGLSAGNPLVAPSFAKIEQGKFMEDYSSDTIGLDADDNLEVKDDSIGTTQLKNGTFTHGLDEGSTVKVDPEDFVGKGLKTFTATSDSELHIQIDVDAVASDGIALDPINAVDGSAAEEFKVDVSDLVNSISGLEVKTELDGYDDLYVKPADGISVDADGVNVVGDELTISAKDSASVYLIPTDSNTKGVQAKHLHINVANMTKGIQKGNGTASDILGSLEIKVDTLAIGFNANGELTILEEGVQGIHLNPNVADTTQGIIVDNDLLKVRLQPGGGLEFDAGEIKLSDEDYLTNKAVTSLNSKVNALTLDADNSGAVDSGISISIDNSAGSTITAKLATDVNTLKTYLGIEGGTYAPLVHTHNIADVTGLQTALDTKLTAGTVYGNNVKIDDINGLQLRDTNSGKWYRLSVSDPGDLFTEYVP